ncbi:heterokaryon incompatibility protein-domain-containing protein [Podospora conica]|nr:heterokaryon incompatibility protein-domain-containing protein [Schizothecium conicum]
MAELAYQQLPAGQRAIRTLRLLPGRWMDQITCELQETCLDDQPTFDALSYVWGDAKDTAVITVDECCFQATKNLISALRRLRSSVDTRTLWVDAICINQKDNRERTQQVQLMADIYQSARTVDIFLGESGILDLITPEEQASWDDPPQVWWHNDCTSLVLTGQAPSKSAIDSRGVLDPVDGLDQTDQQRVEEFFARQRDETSFAVTGGSVQVLRNNQAGAFSIMKMLSNGRCLKSCLHCEVRSPVWAGALEVIEQITHLPWWNRIWVLQEAVLSARESRAIYGEINAPITLIEEAGGILRRHHTNGMCCRSLWDSLPSRQTYILSQFEARMNPLVQVRDITWSPLVEDGQIDRLFILLEITRFKEATDPHDRIYGLLGLVSDGPHPIDLKPDYDVPVQDLFTQLAFRFLTHFRTFLKLTNHELPLPESSPLFYLPSWVPHWGPTYGFLTRDLLVQRLNRYTSWPTCIGPLPTLVKPTVLQVCTKPLSRVSATTPVFTKEKMTADTAVPNVEGEETPESILSAFARTIFGDLIATTDHTLKASNTSFRRFRGSDEAQKAALTLLGDVASSLGIAVNSPLPTSTSGEPAMSLEDAEQNFWYANEGRLFFVTDDGHIGSGPPLMKVGYEVVLVLGSSVPFVLWRTPLEGVPENERCCWLYAGYAYMHGAMDGEAAPRTWSEVEKGYLF